MNSYAENGIVANNVLIKDKNTLSLSYNGLLFESGADVVFVHYGFGAKWTNSDTIAMTKAENGFVVDIPLAKTGAISMAFKDSAENWDNNNNSNYSFTLRARK